MPMSRWNQPREICAISQYSNVHVEYLVTKNIFTVAARQMVYGLGYICDFCTCRSPDSNCSLTARQTGAVHSNHRPHRNGSWLQVSLFQHQVLIHVLDSG